MTLLSPRLKRKTRILSSNSKGKYKDLEISEFRQEKTEIGKRKYAYVPVDRTESFNLYKITEEGKRVKDGKWSLREIRVLSNDTKHQTSIVTNVDAEEQDKIKICESIFGRWGNQENFFKYMIEEFSLDSLLEYNSVKGGEEEKVKEGIDHPNPEYEKLSREIKKLVLKEEKILAKYGLAAEETKELDAEETKKRIAKLQKGKDGKKLEEITKELEGFRIKRAMLDEREDANESGYKKLKSGVKQIADAIKISAYEVETELHKMLERHYTNAEKEGRQVIGGAMQSSGKLEVLEGKLRIKLDEQSAKKRTEAIDRLCEDLNEKKVCFPGTNLVIEFDTNRCSNE